VVAAVVTMWLVARAEGIGMGWISILDPDRVSELLCVPHDWRFIGYFCLGFPEDENQVPELERAGWEHRLDCGEHVLRR
jgi:5,6-dimethylbenzimidazole synthase